MIDPSLGLTVIDKKGNRETFATTLSTTNLEFNQNGQGIYGWVWLSDYRRYMTSGVPIPWRKIGQWGTLAKHGKTPQATIRSYLKGTTDVVVIFYARPFSIHDLKKFTALQVEQLIKPHLGKPINVGDLTECYTYPDYSKEHLDDLINNILYGKSKTFELDNRKSFLMRSSQQRCHDQNMTYVDREVNDNDVVNKFLSGNDSFIPLDYLMGCVMSFGKSFTFLNQAKSTLDKYFDGVGNILIMTGAPNIFDSVMDDLNGHILFRDWNIIHVKDERKDVKSKIKKDRVNVVMVSTQLLNHKNNKDLSPILSKIPFIKAMLDEAHRILLTLKSMSHLTSFNIFERNWVSGTPKKLESLYFFKDPIQKFIYDYFDRAMEERNNPDSNFVSLTCNMIDVPVKMKEEDYWDMDLGEGVTMRKLFSVDSDVRSLWEMILDPMNSDDPKTARKISPYVLAKIKHTLVMLGGTKKDVKRIKGIVDGIIKDRNLKFKTFEATGDGNDKRWNKLKNDIYEANQDGLSTLVFSLGMFGEGVGTGLWDSVFQMGDTKSHEKYFQTSFRCTRPYEGKKESHLFDFNPNRCLDLVGGVIMDKFIDGDTDPQKTALQILDVFPMYRYGKDIMGQKKVDFSDIANVIKKVQFKSDYFSGQPIRNYFDFDEFVENMGVDNLQSILEGVSVVEVGRESITINQSEVTQGKNFKSVPKHTSQVDEEVKARKDVEKLLKSFFSKLPALNQIRGDYTTLSKIYDDFEDDLFYSATKVDKEFLGHIIEHMDTKQRKNVNLYLSADI